MVALGVITLFLLVYSLIYYVYLANHSERDVSFFLSVSLILLVMNLCTNAGSPNGTGLSWLYFVVAIVFIGVGFLVDLHTSIAFYQSIVPWGKETFTDLTLLGWKALSLIIFPAGIACYFVFYKDENKRELALTCGKCAGMGVLLLAFLLWMILGLAL